MSLATGFAAEAVAQSHCSALARVPDVSTQLASVIHAEAVRFLVELFAAVKTVSEQVLERSWKDLMSD